MVGILLLTHAPLGAAFIAAAQHVFQAPLSKLEALDVMPDQDPVEVCALAQAKLLDLDDGSGVLVMTDIIGGTPSNCSMGLGSPGKVQVIAGISLPMLLRALNYREQPLDVVLDKALAGGQHGVCRLDQLAPLLPD